MSRRGDVEFEWAGETRTFRLLFGEILKLQERTDAGPFELLRRLTTGTWRINDIRETIRLGLEGGGMKPNEAGRLIKDYVDPPQPLLDSVLIAARILEAALSGAPDEAIPKSAEAEAKPQNLNAESSLSPLSSVGAQPSDTPPLKFTDSPSGSSKRSSKATSLPTASKTSRKRQAQTNTMTS